MTRASAQVPPELVITRLGGRHQLRDAVGEADGPHAGLAGGHGGQPPLEPGVAPGDGQHVHARLAERLGRGGDRPQAPGPGHEQHAALLHRDAQPLARGGLGRRLVEGGPDAGHDLNPRVGLEAPDRRLSDPRGHEVQVDVALDPEPVRRHIRAEDHVSHRRVALGQPLTAAAPVAKTEIARSAGCSSR